MKMAVLLPIAVLAVVILFYMTRRSNDDDSIDSFNENESTLRSVGAKAKDGAGEIRATSSSKEDLFNFALADVFKRKTSPKTYQKRSVLTKNEIEFHGRLLKALPNLHVFPQVSMGAMMVPTARAKKDKFVDFRRISQKRVDFLICSQSLDSICVIDTARRDCARRCAAA
jgi:Protein of unknown function (DUF2726)